MPRELAAPLLVHQHHVSPGGADRQDACAGQFDETLQRHPGERIVAAGLPDHEIRALGQHIALQAPRHRLGGVTALAAVDHGDRAPARCADLEALLQVALEQGRVGHGR
ncbi:hypothetical protein M2437_002405 [Methylorubrum pseudosasae]|nr:hypothetical protein [Methylorubrum pseudosasae]